jgi:uncharacterized protein YecE (DUF72 family)
MAKVYYGCDERDRDWEDYAERCNTLELDLQRFAHPPKIETLHTWRVESPAGFCFILHAQPEVAPHLPQSADDDPTDFSDDLHEAWEATCERSEALAAKAILLRTPKGFTPSKAHRERLAAFRETFGDDVNANILWEPSGLWNVEQTREAAREADVIPSYDPFLAHREDVPFDHGDAGFVITERAARRRQFDLFDFKQLLDWTQKYDRLFVMLRGRFKWAHAQHVQAAVQQSRAHTA